MNVLGQALTRKYLVTIQEYLKFLSLQPRTSHIKISSDSKLRFILIDIMGNICCDDPQHSRTSSNSSKISANKKPLPPVS